ncbi:hypothetical protein LR48_Vigan01g135900 [Vigna angularis]|uniref:PB1-like domain-containing protein n=1 Tax=Phaseolus angularis TaxID=3914 RepID=A0A0L9TMI5_PHAAN|nr:hypothetical protein LR48_Vigan01g135900 [Vigna angularis]
MAEHIKVVVHHCGHFVSDENGNFKFDDKIAEWSCDPDLWCYFGILASVKDLGYIDIKELWYSLGGHSVVADRLELLTDDRGVMHMLNIARLNDEVHLYVVHNTMEPEIIEMIDWVDGDVNDEVDVAREVEGEPDEVDVAREVEGEPEGEVHGDVEGHCEDEVEGEGDVQPEVGTEMEEGHCEDEVEGEGQADVHPQVGTEMEEGHCEDEVEGEGQADVHPKVGTEMEEGHCEAEVETQVGTELEEGDCEVAKQIEHVEDGEVHDVEEVENNLAVQ